MTEADKCAGDLHFCEEELQTCKQALERELVGRVELVPVKPG